MNKKASTEAKNEVKIVSAKATETVKAAAEKAADTAKAAAVKTAAVAKEVKEEVKKTAAKTIDRKPSKKVEEKKAEAVTEVYVQFGGRETTLDSVVAKATELLQSRNFRFTLSLRNQQPTMLSMIKMQERLIFSNIVKTAMKGCRSMLRRPFSLLIA